MIGCPGQNPISGLFSLIAYYSSIPESPSLIDKIVCRNTFGIQNNVIILRKTILGI